ncbi:MAG TPA: glycosyltransferase family 39 protein [Thermoanaerobaculales bacterium]|nr:glycosyltransferase family 39 protein [Thermoanaerobaculales bacterium]HQL29211.1 glycosyltransferase family 39 protein [Thermoanaerobaculales bacterium]
MGEATAAPSLLDRLLRPGRTSPRDVAVDLIWLLGLGLLLMGAGIGLRDPWPADEPRFALVAQDMLRSSDWLIPRIGGDTYADKPPAFFWLMAGSMAATGSLRIGFLLPSLLSGLGTLVLVYDLLRRLRGREAALAGGLLLLLTFQFVWQARLAQIDATLCVLTTLSLYGLLRHLAVGPAHGWYLAGWAAAGLGVITKGVGFLPLLILVPFALLVRRGWPAAARAGWLWLIGLLCMLAAIGLWLAPMLAASASSPELAAYRDEILLRQTVTRYAEAWHHNEPFWYYPVSVIPLLWLPLIALVPWLWPRWRQAVRERDTVVVSLLAWVVVVVLFFSLSSGKRGVYVLPALPALAMAAAPWLPELLRSRGTRRLAFVLASLLTGVVTALAAAVVAGAPFTARIAAEYGEQPVWPLALMAAAAVVALAVLRVRDGWLAYGGVLAAVLVVIGLAIAPRIDAVRSCRAFMERVEQASAGIAELGLAGAKEQYLLQARRPLTTFGHARWWEKEAEAADAAAWLAAGEGRGLLIGSVGREACFPDAPAVDLGRANREHWFLLTGPPDAACVARGDLGRAIHYLPARATRPDGSHLVSSRRP